jgi:hypothetical protein
VLPVVPKLDWWRFITSWGQSKLYYYEVFDERTNETQDVFIGDTVLLRFADDTTIEAEFLGTTGTQIFRILIGTGRDANGDLLSGSVAGSPSTAGSSAFIDGYLQYAEFDAEPRFDCAMNIVTESCEVYGPQICFVVIRAQSVPFCSL